MFVTSVKGLYSWPANSAYHVTKHSLETMADSLRMEMVKFGVQVSIVEPGNFSTVTACQTEEHVNCLIFSFAFITLIRTANYKFIS